GAGTPVLGVDRIEVDLDRLSWGDGVLDIAIRSTLGDAQEGFAGTSVNASIQGQSVQDSSTAPVFFVNGTSGPDASALEVMVMGVSPGTPSRQYWDMIGIQDTSGKSGGDTLVHGSEAFAVTPPDLPYWPGGGE